MAAREEAGEGWQHDSMWDGSKRRTRGGSMRLTSGGVAAGDGRVAAVGFDPVPSGLCAMSLGVSSAGFEAVPLRDDTWPCISAIHRRTSDQSTSLLAIVCILYKSARLEEPTQGPHAQETIP